MDLIWREPQLVRSFDTGPGVLLTPAGLCRMFQEAAGRHADHMGLGVGALRENNRSWVLSKFTVRVHRLPKRGDEVVATTWPSRRTAGIRAWRDFQLRDAWGGLLAEAASMWLILDLESRRPVRLPRELTSLELPERLADVEPESWGEEVGREYGRREFAVLWSDLDENRHVNNVAYLVWALDSLAAEIHDGFAPVEFHIEFLAETFLGDAIAVGTREWNGVAGCRKFGHLITANGAPAARVITCWRG